MVSDLALWFRNLQRRDVLFGFIAFAITSTVLVAFWVEQRFTNPVKRGPTIIYAESWRADRTREDTLRVQRRSESARQLAIAEFEGQRAEALLRRARGDEAKAAQRAAIERYRADAVRWKRELAEAERDLAQAAIAARNRLMQPPEYPPPRSIEPIAPPLPPPPAP